MEPVFIKSKAGKLSLADTSEAIAVRRENRGRAKALEASVVRKHAEAAVRRLNGDVANKVHLLGQFTIQFGQFRNETFQWLASNALGYAAFIVASSEKDPKSADARWVNKMALKNYLSLFREGLEAIQLKKNEKQGPKALVKGSVKPSADTTEVFSDTDDQELSEMVEKMEHDLAASQKTPSVRNVSTVSNVTKSQGSDFQSSVEKSSDFQCISTIVVTSAVTSVISTGSTEHLQSPVNSSRSSSKSPGSAGKTVRSVSGAPKKTVRSLFLGHAASSTESNQFVEGHVVTSSQQMSLKDPVSDTEVPLLKKWRASLSVLDHDWVSAAVFVKDHLGKSRFEFSKVKSLWIYPPQPPIVPQSVPRLDHFFGHRMFLWMPVKLWALKRACPHPDCECKALSYAGVYQVVRQVLDVSGYYNLISETLWCKQCKRKTVSWSFSILKQVDVGHRSMFPCLLTTMKACDMKVVILLRQRGLGNSASQVQKKLQEQHSTNWYNRTIQYLSACKSIKSAATSGLVQQQSFEPPPPMTPVPLYRWLMQVYIQDVLQRLDEVKASITSVFGRILKVDSTKKVTKKLAGPSAGTVEWATNVGNEYGQILMSVMTAGEGRFGLFRMAKGLMKRYADANQPAPEVMYVDRDCCGRSSIKVLFADWSNMHVRLDIWHFMRRLSSGCNTDSHPLYSLFMQKISQCIFAWDHDDLQALKAAKRSELVSRHIPHPSEEQIMGSITKNEIALHCRRQTRGAEETIRLIASLIDAFDGEKGRDTLGVPLLNSKRMREEWEGQKKHVACLQDPDQVQLYIQTGSLKKGGHVLPTYRSCRGSTSLESFHLHLNRFIPGTLANDTVFQAYLVDGLSRWNQDRASVLTSTNEPQSYSGLLRFTANQLTEEIFKKRISAYIPPRKYTGELIGIEYLYDQTGRPLQEYDDAIQTMEDDGLEVPEEDEGFQDIEQEDMTLSSVNISDVLTSDQSEPQQLSPGTPKVQLQRVAPVLEPPTLTSIVCDQSEPQQLSPGTPKEQSQRVAPVLEQPTLTSKVCDQSEPQQLSPGTPKEQSQRVAPVLEQPTSAILGGQFEPQAEMTPAPRILRYPSETEYREMYEVQPMDVHESVGPDHIEGFHKVQALAAYLVDLQHANLCLSNPQAEEIKRLWMSLNEYDKKAIVFNPMYAKHSKGRFRAKRQAIPGVESTERSIRGPDSIPAARPDCNRYVEGVIKRLCSQFPGPRRREGHVWSRWSLILEAYSKIKTTVLSSATITATTSLQLPDISQKTLKAWHNDKARADSRQVLQQGIRLPEMSFTATKVIPDPQRRPGTLPRGSGEPHQFHLPVDTAGSVVQIFKERRPPSTSSKQQVAETSVVDQQQLPILETASVPYTTLRYRKRKEAEEAAGFKRRSYKKTKTAKNCKKCGEIIEKPNHINYFGNLYCVITEQQNYQDWKQQFSLRNYGKKK